MAYQRNPPSDIPIVQRPPTRLVASDTISIGAGKAIPFYGSNNRQDRIEIIVTNLDLQTLIKIQKLNGVNAMTVFPQTAEGLETNDDVQVYNGGANAVNVEVCEIYPDDGNRHGLPRLAVPGAGAGAGAGAGTGTGGGGRPAGGGGAQPP